MSFTAANKARASKDSVSRAVYESAVKGRQDFREAFKVEREKTKRLTEALRLFIREEHGSWFVRAAPKQEWEQYIDMVKE